MSRVSHSVTHAEGRCASTSDPNPSFRSFHLFLLSAQDWPFIVVFLRSPSTPPANCSFSCQLLTDWSSHHRDGQICEAISGEFPAESGKISTSIESGKISTSISAQKPSTPATAPSESVLWTVMRNHATAACSTVTDKEEEGTDNEGPRRNCQTPHIT